MKKKLCAAALLLGAGMCVLAGCGGSGGSGEKPGEAVADTETQVFLDYKASDYVTLGEYKGLSVKYPVPSVSDDDVWLSIEEMLSDSTEYNEVTRAAQAGDYLSIDYKGMIDGEEFDGGTMEECELTLGEEELFGEEFDRNLIGKNIGEDIVFQMTIPEDFYEEEAGKTAEFTVRINSVSEVKVPEYTDEFVAQNTEYDTMEAYEEALREELIASAQEEAASGAGEDALDLAVANATINGYPQELYDACYTSVMEEYQQYADMFGVELGELIRDFMGEDDLDSITLESVNDILVSQAIAEKEGFMVTAGSYTKEAEELAEEYGYDSLDDFTADYGKVSIMTLLVRGKALEFLYENANVEEVSEEEYYGEDEELEGTEEPDGTEASGDEVLTPMTEEILPEE